LLVPASMRAFKSHPSVVPPALFVNETNHPTSFQSSPPNNNAGPIVRYSMPPVTTNTRNEFGTLLAIKAMVGVIEAAVNSKLHGSKFTDALAGEVVGTLLTSAATTALDTTVGDQLPSKRAKDQSLALINAGVTMLGAVGLTLWNKHAAPDSAVKGAMGWTKALGLNLAIGLMEGGLADRWLKREESLSNRSKPATTVASTAKAL
jgi:hypothetical protein